MLFILSGNIQIGKTRWLERLVEDLSSVGIPCAGVLAPGVWRLRSEECPGKTGDCAGTGDYEKLGINNVLLPGGEVIPFAVRRDLLQAQGGIDATSQSERAQLGWAIDDAAIERVNAHFSRLRKSQAPVGPSLLIVDELGQLELNRGEGLTEAMSLLRQGPSKRFPHAIVVVREWLVPDAVSCLEEAWGQCACVSPDEKARKEVFAGFGLTQD